MKVSEEVNAVLEKLGAMAGDTSSQILTEYTSKIYCEGLFDLSVGVFFAVGICWLMVYMWKNVGKVCSCGEEILCSRIVASLVFLLLSLMVCYILNNGVKKTFAPKACAIEALISDVRR